MIRYVQGNLLESKAEAIVNTVNTMGVMGKGIALQFKEAYPSNYNLYKKVCKNNELRPGKLLIHSDSNLYHEKIIINFPTKTHWRLPSQYSYIEDGLKEMVNEIRMRKINSVAIPPLGCGNGKLEWKKVKVIMEHYLSDLEDVDVEIYEPAFKIKTILINKLDKPSIKLTTARAMLLYSLFEYERMGEMSSVFVANKLAFFLQCLGENLKLDFKARYYGPYAIGVEKVLYHLNGTYLTGLEQLEFEPFEEIYLDYSKKEHIYEFVHNKLSATQKARLDKLTVFIEGFQSTLSLEILSSVAFVMLEKQSFKLDSVYDSIMGWSERKRDMINLNHVSIALNHIKTNEFVV